MASEKKYYKLGHLTSYSNDQRATDCNDVYKPYGFRKMSGVSAPKHFVDVKYRRNFCELKSSDFFLASLYHIDLKADE